MSKLTQPIRIDLNGVTIQIAHDVSVAVCAMPDCKVLLIWNDCDKHYYEARSNDCVCVRRAFCCLAHRDAFRCRKPSCTPKRSIAELEATVRELQQQLADQKSQMATERSKKMYKLI